MSDQSKLRDELAEAYSGELFLKHFTERQPSIIVAKAEKITEAFKAGFDAGYKARDEEFKVNWAKWNALNDPELVENLAVKVDKLREALEKTHQKAHDAFKLIDCGDSISAADKLESIIDDAQEALKDTEEK